MHSRKDWIRGYRPAILQDAPSDMKWNVWGQGQWLINNSLFASPSTFCPAVIHFSGPQIYVEASITDRWLLLRAIYEGR